MGTTKTKGKTNQEAYATYRHFVEKQNLDTTTRQQREKVRRQVPSEYTLLIQLVGSWSARYFRRLEAIHQVLADTEAKEILVARHRAHNASYQMPTEFTPKQIEVLQHSTSFSSLDVSSLTEVPSYGPSVISLWTDAKNAGLSSGEAQASIEDWQYHTPPAWACDDERKKKKLPRIEEAVQARLNHLVMWQQTGDLFIPWNLQVEGQKWEVRINDFPDEYMYSLLIDGALLGDFHEWPEAWDRGAGRAEAAAAAKPAVVPVFVDPERLVTRYQAGECEAVWRDLRALGAHVREPAYAAAGDLVARETMRRVRHNFELIVERLKSIEYQFFGGQWEAPELREDAELIAACEQEGLFLPLCLKTFVEQFGAIWLLGSHPRLAPEGIDTDSLMVGGLQVLDGTFEQWSETDPKDRTSMLYEVCPDAESKLGILDGEVASDFLCIAIPNEAADAPLEGEPEGRTLVEYLRWSFQWGGFPGWEKQTNRPEKELAFLRDGLLPI